MKAPIKDISILALVALVVWIIIKGGGPLLVLIGLGVFALLLKSMR